MNHNMNANESSKAIARAITAIVKSYGQINLKVQDCAVAIVYHASVHGECNKAAPLVRALPPKLRPLLVKWFMRVSPIGVKLGDEAASDKAKFIKQDSKAYNPFDLALANAINWWEIEPKEPVEPTLEMFSHLHETLAKTLDRFATETGLAKFQPADRALVKSEAQFLKQEILARISVIFAAQAATQPGSEQMLRAVNS